MRPVQYDFMVSVFKDEKIETLINFRRSLLIDTLVTRDCDF